MKLLYVLVFSVFMVPFLLGCSSKKQPQKAQKPNVILIIADDLGYADLSFQKHSPADVKTPSLDRLRKAGAYFSNAYATAPICSPARAGLSTGRYQQRWGNYWYNSGGLTLDEKTIAHYLKDLGYVTKKIGKTHLNGGPAEFPLDHGFDEYLGFESHTWDYIRLTKKDREVLEKRAGKKNIWRDKSSSMGPLTRGRNEKVEYKKGFTTEIFTDEAVEYIKRDHKGKPFFIQLEHNAVHMPTYVCDPDYAAKFGIKDPKWDPDNPIWGFPYWDPKKETWKVWHKKWGHLGAVDPQGRKRYLSHLAAMDDSLGRIMDELKKAGKLENTIVIFTSDNGGTINTYSDNTPLSGYKYMLGEGGIRLPMLISWQGKVKANITVDALSSTMDLLPTIIDLVGGVKGKNLDGKSAIAELTGKGKFKGHTHLVWSKGDGNPKDLASGMWVIRSGDWKLCHNAGWTHLNFKMVNGKCVRDKEYVYADGIRLYNLKDDIGEKKDLSKKHPEKVAELTKLYKAWRKQMPPMLRGNKRLKYTRDWKGNK